MRFTLGERRPEFVGTGNKAFSARMLILGSPAKVARKLTGEVIAANTAAAERYVANAGRCRTMLQQI